MRSMRTTTPTIMPAVFNPSNPRELWSGHDGGVSRTSDVTAASVTWENRNANYHVAQFYGIAQSQTAGDRRLIGGVQDQGAMNFRLADAGGFDGAVRFIRGDGGYTYLGDRYVFTGMNSGVLFRSSYFDSSHTQILAGGRVFHPSGLTSGLRFIHPFAVDPGDESKMYYPVGNTMWRNEDLNVTNPAETWTTLDVAAPSGYSITAVTASVSPADTCSTSERATRIDRPWSTGSMMPTRRRAAPCPCPFRVRRRVPTCTRSRSIHSMRTRSWWCIRTTT